jgi:heme-degrading monooxygenase HmoA
MFTEIVQIAVKPGAEALFEAGAEKARPLFLGAKGCHGMALQRSVENPSTYFLIVKWETIENHMVDFRNAPEFAQWRALVGPHFAEGTGPQMQHLTEIFS